MELREGRVVANELEFAYLEAGEGPLALCLHGFPDSAWTWRHLLPVLADAGYRAVAPWLRGYAPTAVPANGRYQTGALAADANALHEALGGGEPGVIVGHDWGAMATYGAAAHEPDRWRRVVTMAVPPAAVLGNAFFGYDQIKRSFYIFFFQTPLAELAVPMDDLEFVARLWADWSPGYDGAEDIAHVKDALREPERTLAAISYYRAMFDPSLHDPTLADIQNATALLPPQPTLYLHGTDDGCIGPEVAEDAKTVMSDPHEFRMVEGAGHFLHVEKPDEVNGLVVDWVTAT